MSSVAVTPQPASSPPPYNGLLPDHTQLPDSDGVPVENFFEHPQSILLTSSLWPILMALHPDGQFAVGQNSGIYFKPTDPPLVGCRAPDWFYVPGVPPTLEGHYRRSYVMWQELVAPLVLMEFVSGNGVEERNRTPGTGKFWVYEQAIGASYYVIFEPDRNNLEVYELVRGRFRHSQPNVRGHFVIEPLGIELGLHQATFMSINIPWLRAFNLEGRLILSAEEIAEIDKQRADEEKHRAEVAVERAKVERQRAEAERQRAEAEKQRAEAEKQRAEAEKQRADRLAAQLKALGVDPEKV